MLIHRGDRPDFAGFVCALFLAGGAVVQGAERDVQIRSIDLESGIIELFNFGTTDQSLSGWRFCTHDENEIRRYSSSTGLDGVTIEAQSSFTVHTNDDATGGSDSINLSALGPFAQPVDTGPFGMQLYFPPAIFGDGNQVADHLQWSVDGVDNSTADERSDEAESGGVWIDQSQWIATTLDTTLIQLVDTTGGVLHGPADYEVIEGAAPLTDPIPEPIPRGNVSVVLETVATGLTAPNWGIVAPGQSDRLFVSDQDGILWAIDLATGTKTVFLDLTARLVTLGVFGPDSFDERGLLGFAFAPDYETSGLLYTYASEPVDGPADFSTLPDGVAANHQSVVTEWVVPDPTDPLSVVDPGSARTLLRVDQPQFNHDGGGVNFGPDGMLYVAFGDGGGADDVDGQDFLGSPIVGHGTGNGQDATNPLGTIVRIDPSGFDSANGQYGIPADNPFVLDAQKLDEIFAFGLRNPFRFSFDSLTGELIVADVGQNDIEEINNVAAGGNYGWNLMEGSFFFDANGNDDGFVTDQDPGVPSDLELPIAEYDHDEGLAIIGGFVYRGSAIPELEGKYVFGDFARTFANDGRLFHLTDANEVVEFDLLGQSELGLSLLGFGQDAGGEIYVLANGTGTPFGDTGVVLRLAPAMPPACTLVAAPQAGAEGIVKSRYLTLQPGNAGEVAAIRVELTNLDGFADSNGAVRWVGAPQTFPEEDSSDPARTFTGAPLSCAPHFQDWGTIDTLHVFGAEIIPNSQYTVQMVHQDCQAFLDNPLAFSFDLDHATGAWGDTVSPFFMPGGTAQPDFNDIAGTVSKFLAVPGAPIKALAQLQPNVVFPDRPVDFKDVADSVSAFLGSRYADVRPDATACPCPSDVTCSTTACGGDGDCAGGFCLEGFCTDACGRCATP